MSRLYFDVVHQLINHVTRISQISRNFTLSRIFEIKGVVKGHLNLGYTSGWLISNTATTVSRFTLRSQSLYIYTYPNHFNTLIELVHWCSDNGGDYRWLYLIYYFYTSILLFTQNIIVYDFCRTTSANNRGKPCYICPDEHCRFLMWETEISSEYIVTHTGQWKLTGRHIALIQFYMHVMTHYDIYWSIYLMNW